MTTKIQEIAEFLSTMDIRNITGLSALSIPDGIMDTTQKEILATYVMELTEESTARFPSSFWTDWEAVFEGGDSEPFANADLDMGLYVVDKPVEKEEPHVEPKAEAPEKVEVAKEPEPVKEPVKEEVKTESIVTKQKPTRKPRKKTDDVSEALFHLIPVELRLDIMLQHVKLDDFGSLTKDQLTAILVHKMKVTE